MGLEVLMGLIRKIEEKTRVIKTEPTVGTVQDETRNVNREMTRPALVSPP